MKLLICGSRHATKGMKATAWAAVRRAKELGWEIIVGDAPGVDRAVIEACIEYDVPCHAYGIHIRRRYIAGVPYIKLNVPGDWPKNPYLFRDKVMVEMADFVYAIWNHESRGTRWTYDYARQAGKEAWIT